ncbi:toll-like receptor 6 [Pararge aegeria]|uniref:Jg26929 protein n=1 Tax=Pararge aegeria aegeria TaxID=348720 RepID=A0A8S4QIH8_9NEOP|nr:toll-like receptor 6 [Pararge aegeria]CAH2210301.1 jg26929 [Pararge aegeria aegeria]
MPIKRTIVNRLELRKFNFLVYVLFCCYVVERSTAAEMPHECAYRTSETETSEDAVLFCKIRTISSLDHLLQNISRTHFDDVISLHVQCSEILFFESTLAAQTEKSSGKHSTLGKLRDLVIDKCKIRQIPARAFENFKDLKSLHVTTHNSEWSAMTMELHEHAFTGLSELIELDLSDNNIWSTKTDTFCSLYSLKTLNMTRNHLQNIKTIGFSDSAREQNLSVKSCNLVLEALDMSYNDLIVITENSLSKLRSLSKLFLQNNAISTLEGGAFEGLISLQVLNLSSNFMNTIPPDIYSDTKFLKEIILSNNTITVLPPGLFQGLEQLQVLDLSNNELTSQWINKGTFAGLLRMVILNISYNRLSKIDRFMFQDLYSLQKLNLEHNEISIIDEHAFEQLRNLHSLTLSNNKLVHVHTNIFTDLHVLHDLFLDNNKIKHIDEYAFENMTAIEDLGLNDNLLPTIPTSIRKLRSLRSLDIGNNNITHLNRENFHGLTDLFGLRLVDNKVTHLNEDTFEHLPHLQILNLASNKIKLVSTGCFRKNVNLQLLRMDGNDITTFDGIFSSLNSLVWLNMSANRISSFNFNSFPGSLEWLDLHMNFIDNIYYVNELNSNINIKLLDLSYNNITQLTVSSIPKSIEKLYLNNNNIQHIQVGTFSKIQKLSIVTLNNNKIVQLDMNAFRLDQIDEDSDLPEFFISGNPFVCDCSMEWIQRINYLSHSRQYPRVLDLDKAFCSLVHSRAKEKKMIIDMSPSDFLCPYESHCFALCHCCDFVACDCEMICPNNCKCYHDITWNANVVDCSNAGYTEVPDRIPMDATEIYLDGNDISNLGNHVFIGKKKLQVLYLNNTKLKEVNNQTFKGVDSLRVLHLEGNKLVELKGDEFVHLNNLNELYLDHNAIVHVANNTFSALKSLSVLRIDDNKLVNFFPWKLLASSSKSLAHVSIEGNQYSCDCKSIAELDTWLRKDPGDPEKMLCTDTEGKSTKITIASVLSHCKEYLGSKHDPTVSKNEIVSKSLFLPDNYFAVICGIIIIIVIICLVGAIFYAFRYDVSDWLYTNYGVPLFKEQSCPNVDHVLEGNSNHMYEYYVICNTKDTQFIYHNIMSEIEFRKMSSKKFTINESSLNILTLDSFSKSSKLSKRLLIVLTTNFICNDLCDFHFKNMFYSYLKSLNRSDMNKIIFVKIVDNNQINDELCFVLDKFKNISWNDPRFWDKFIALLNSTDTIITVKSTERNVFKKSLRQTPTLRYTTMPVTNDSCSKKTFSNSLQYCKRNDGETSQNESSPSSDNTYGEGNNSNNSYMSIDNRTCPRFNYDLRLSPSSGHVYSRVEDISPTVPRSIANTTAKGRTYFV